MTTIPIPGNQLILFRMYGMVISGVAWVAIAYFLSHVWFLAMVVGFGFAALMDGMLKNTVAIPRPSRFWWTIFRLFRSSVGLISSGLTLVLTVFVLLVVFSITRNSEVLSMPQFIFVKTATIIMAIISCGFFSFVTGRYFYKTLKLWRAPIPNEI